jgi:hypothetical protein
MGKLVRFPAHRSRRLRRASAVAFPAFGELASTERAQFKLFAGCVGAAVAVMGLLQLALG